LVQTLEQRPSVWRDPAEILPAIPGAALAPDEPFRFEAVEQPRNPRRLLDHPVGDIERRDAGVAAAPKDAEHVELLQGDAGRLDYFGEPASDHVGGV
jgi:hypothetical protein